VPKFFQFMGFNLLLAFLCSLSLFLISPAASGSGIPDVKAYLNGAESPIFRWTASIVVWVLVLHSAVKWSITGVLACPGILELAWVELCV